MADSWRWDCSYQWYPVQRKQRVITLIQSPAAVSRWPFYTMWSPWQLWHLILKERAHCILGRTLSCRVSLAPTWGSLLFLPRVLEASSSGQNMVRSNLGHCSAPKKLSMELDSKSSLGCIYFQLKEDSWFCELRGYHNYCKLGESGRMFTWAFYTLLWTISSLSYTPLNTFIIAFPVMSCKTF